MKLNPNYPGALPKYLLAALLLPSFPLAGQSITNPSFSDNTFTASNGYASFNGGVINGWTLSNPAFIGQNLSPTSAFANNGAIPTGPNVLFIQAGANAGSNNVKATISGLTPETKYNVSFRVNARFQGTKNLANLVFSTDAAGSIPVAAEVTNVSDAVNATPYKYVGFEFTAKATSHQITITNTKTTGDHTLLVDDVTIAPSTGAWSFAPWTGDADSGVDPQYVYTHAHDFTGGALNVININGVDFINGDQAGSNRFTVTDLFTPFNNVGVNNITGESSKLAKDFIYNGANTGITLQNLKPNTQYVFTLYGIGFDVPGTQRSSTFSSSLSSEKFTANLSQYGQGNGLLVNYKYTTDALGTPVAISYPTHGSGTFHSSGFSNREAVANTQPSAWTALPWSDDETSGVSSNHPYTHAFSFGSATSSNVNGVNFTGIAGGNPAGTGYTSAGLANVYNNDSNSVTGYGSALARDFVFGGFPETHNLTGLTAGKEYVFTIYSVGWDDGARRAAFAGVAGGGLTTLNQDTYGNNQGVRFEYRYTAGPGGTATITASGLDITTTGNIGKKSIHTYGISNREAAPFVNKAPEFTLQPVSATLGKGADITLRGAAIGSAELSYQWKKGAANVAGATEPVLVLNDVTTADAGTYTLVVTNGATTTSEPATISVLENVPGFSNSGVGVDGLLLAGGAVDPHFKLITNPDNTASDLVYVQSAPPGAWLANSETSKWIGPRANSAGSAGLTVDAGAGPGVYIYRRSLDLTGFDLSTVAINGSWATDNTGVEIRVNGTVVGFPNSTGTTFAQLVPFSISNSAFPGLLTAGVNTVDFVVRNEDPLAAGGFTGVRIEGFTAIGTIPAGTAPHIAEQPVGGVGPHGGIVTLAVAASGSAPLSYQWFNGAAPVEGAIDPVFVLPIEDLNSGGSYKVRVTNGVTFVDSDPAVVTVTNADPTTEFDLVSTNANVPLNIEVFTLLANDSDPDGDLLTFTSVNATGTTVGAVSESLGMITYTPPTGFTGSDSFTYTVNDGIWGGTTTETVIVTVNAAATTPPGQLALVISGGTATGTFTGTPGKTYILQRSTDLSSPWTNVDTEVAPESGIVTVLDPGPVPAPKAFYRISYTP